MTQHSNPFIRLRQEIMAPLQHRSFIALASVLLLSLLFEFAAYRQLPVLSWLAPRLWLATGLMIACLIVTKGMLSLYADIRQKNIAALGVFLFVAGLLLWPLLDRTRSVIGQDATQQLTAGLAAFSETDWRFTGKAFLDYPSRQYLLAALPALLLGRTETALQIGFAWPFWLSLILFVDSLRRWARDKGLDYGDRLTLVTVTAVFAFPYVTEYYLYFEHTLFPFCFTLQAIGWLLHFMRRPTLWHALAFTWTGTMLIYCYTTALAAVLLLIIVLLLFSCSALHIRKKTQKESAACTVNPSGNIYFSMSCLLIAATVTLTLLLSVLFGRGDRVTVLRSHQVQDLLQASLTGLRIALLHDPAIYATFYLPFVWLYLAAGLSFTLGRYHALFTSWTLGVIILSQVLQGYAIYPAPVSFSRTLVTVPVLLTAWFFICTDPDAAGRLGKHLHALGHTGLLHELRRHDFAKILLTLIITLNLVIGFHHINKPVVQGDAAKYVYPAPLQQMQLLISDLNQRVRQEGLTEYDSFTFILYTDNVWLKNPGDYFGYFFPEARVDVLSSGSPLPENLDWQKPILIYIRDGEPGDVPLIDRQIECGMLQLTPDITVPLQRVIIRPGQVKE